MVAATVLTRRVSGRGVHDSAQRDPGPGASPMASHYVGYEEWLAAPFTRGELARCGVALILGFGDSVCELEPSCPPRPLGAFVVGHQSGPSLTGIDGHQHGVQVELTPAGALALFGAGVAELTDAVVPIEQVLGARSSELVERLADAVSWDRRFDILDATLGRIEPTAALSAEVAWLARRISGSSGRARVEPLMDETGWSRRHLTARFRAQLGITPKAYGRVLRFRHAAELLSIPAPGRAPSLAEVAVAAGYYDQSHLNRDFVAMSGCTPGQFLAQADLVPEVRFVQDDDAP